MATDGVDQSTQTVFAPIVESTGSRRDVVICEVPDRALAKQRFAGKIYLPRRPQQNLYFRPLLHGQGTYGRVPG